jgi:carbon-monoxide dehydrogenase small subunit
MISIKALLERNPEPSLDEIRDALASNFCRCTGYMQIYDSVRLAMERMRVEKAAD